MGHINPMSDEHDIASAPASAAPAEVSPQYRVRTPAGQNTAPKSVENAAPAPVTDDPATDDPATGESEAQKEIGGPKGLEPTRFGDWERDGRCVDF